MSTILQKLSTLLFSSFSQTALLQGISDMLVIRWDNGTYHSTPFVVCFGHHVTTAPSKNVHLYVNDTLITDLLFTVDQYGYVHPMRVNSRQIQAMHLRYGRNTIKFQLTDRRTQIQSEIYLYTQHDRLLVSDMDGTLTKDDLGGLYNNYRGSDYLHEGYYNLIQSANKAGYKIVWLTMRSLPLYSFSKSYIRKHTNTHGILLTQPEQMLPALKKQLLKQTGNTKTNMMLTLRRLFPEHCNCFAGGLGNRENDAIAYRAAGIPLENIFIVDTKSVVHRLSVHDEGFTYQQMSQDLGLFFGTAWKQGCKSLSLGTQMQGEGDEEEESGFMSWKNKGHSSV